MWKYGTGELVPDAGAPPSICAATSSTLHGLETSGFVISTGVVFVSDMPSICPIQVAHTSARRGSSIRHSHIASCCVPKDSWLITRGSVLGRFQRVL